MNKFIITVCILTLFLTTITLADADQYRVTRVHDGDSVLAFTNGKEINVRLVGIDAPELSKKMHIPGQPFSLKAKEHLATLVLNKAVTIQSYGKDRYGWSMCEIFVDEVNINLEMLKAGMAEVYRGKPAKGLDIAIYRDAETTARDKAIGIWELRDQYFSPMDWREMYR